MESGLRRLRRALFLISAPMVFITFALPLRAQDLGASGFEIGLLYSVFTVSLLVLRPLVGVGLDIVGRRFFFVAAMALYFVANGLYAISDEYAGLFVARILQGLGFSVLSITTDTITADLTQPEERSAAMGANIASQTRGGMLGAFVGFSLVGLVPAQAWVLSFSVFALIAFSGVIFSIRAIPETSPHRGKSHARAPFSFAAANYRLLIIIFFAAFAAAVIQPYYLVYLRGRLDLEMAALAGVFLPVGVAYALLPGWLGRVTRAFNRATAVALGLTAAGVLYAAVPHIDALPWLIAAFVGAAVGNVLADLTRNAWVGDIAALGAAGRTYALAAFAAGLGAVAGPLAGGYVFDNLGMEYIFYAAAGVFITAAVLALGYLRGKA